MIIPVKYQRNFYQFASGKLSNMYPSAYPSEATEDAVYFGLSSVENFCAYLAWSHLDQLDDAAGCREWLAEAAACFVDRQERAVKSTGHGALRAMFRLGTCHDPGMLRRLATGYLDTPHARDDSIARQKGYGRFWHFARVLATFYAGQSAECEQALDALRNAPAPSHGKYTAAWFGSMRNLALEVLDAAQPDPGAQLRVVAELNQDMWKRAMSDALFETLFAEMAMAFVPAAMTRGWRVPSESLHPSLPLQLFTLPPIKVTIRSFEDLGTLTPPNGMAELISELANPTKKKRTTKRKRTARKRVAKGRAT